MRLLALGLLSFSLTGCGSDPFNPDTVDLAGTWIFNATIVETTQTCNVRNAPITFTSLNADSLVGEGGVGGTIQCSDGSQTFPANPYLEHTTVFMIHAGMTVRIDRPGSLLFKGELRSATRMSGTVTIDSLPGNWAAQRQ